MWMLQVGERRIGKLSAGRSLDIWCIHCSSMENGARWTCRSGCRCCGSCATRSASRARSSAAESRSAAPARCWSTGSRHVRASYRSPASGRAPCLTIESLPQDASHPLQQAWLEHDVPQCGYCQAGQLMAASALLTSTPNPTDAQIDAAMSGNVCRCGTYVRIKQAIKQPRPPAEGGSSHGDHRA